jgi:hypothetical protein
VIPERPDGLTAIVDLAVEIDQTANFVRSKVN